MSGTMTGALLCSLGLVMEELGEEDEDEGTLGDSLSPLLMATADGLVLLLKLLIFGPEFSAGYSTSKYFLYILETHDFIPYAILY